jgi:hypothetical protein
LLFILFVICGEIGETIFGGKFGRLLERFILSVLSLFVQITEERFSMMSPTKLKNQIKVKDSDNFRASVSRFAPYAIVPFFALM